MIDAKAGCRTFIALLVLIAALAGMAHGQTKDKPGQSDEQQDIRREIRELKQGQEAIQKELQEIKKLLLAKEGAARPARPENINIAGRPFRGNQNAHVVFIEFSDYQCPFCGRFYHDTLPQVDKEYIGAGKIKYVFNHLPLDDLHPVAFKAAEAVECAGDQGKFWDLHARLFANQSLLANVNWSTQAKTIGLNLAQFDQCLESGKTEAVVRASVEQAGTLGVQATPSFVIGLVDAKNPGDTNIKILNVISGAYPFPVFKSAIDKALATQ